MQPPLPGVDFCFRGEKVELKSPAKIPIYCRSGLDQ